MMTSFQSVEYLDPTMVDQGFENDQATATESIPNAEAEAQQLLESSLVVGRPYQKQVGPYGVYGVLQVLQPSVNSFTVGVVIGAGFATFHLNRNSPKKEIYNSAGTGRLEVGINVHSRRVIARYCTRPSTSHPWPLICPWQILASW
jgi:hypothetical protein